MSVCGNYVKTFAEASHALPEGMHMNADYPFMIPPIVARDAETVTIRGNRYSPEIPTATFRIERAGGREFGYIIQSSSFEKIFNRKGQRFKLLPFKDRDSPAIGGGSGQQGLFEGEA